MKKISILNQYNDICSSLLKEIATKLSKSFKTFLMETLVLYMVIPGRINFLQLGRSGSSCEQRYRQNFSNDFDWLDFNVALSKRILLSRCKRIYRADTITSKSCG